MLEIIRSAELENIDAEAFICYIERGHEYFLDMLTDKRYDYDTKAPLDMACVGSTRTCMYSVLLILNVPSADMENNMHRMIGISKN